MALAAGTPAFAQDALVEEADQALGLQRFDYLYAGKTIDLGPDRRLEISYIRSCWRESIVGGRVTIGRDTSEIVGGEVERVRMKCNASALRLRPDEGQQAAVMIFRAPADPDGRRTRSLSDTITVHNVVFGTSPIVELPGGGTVRIERLDMPGERLQFEVPRGSTFAQSRHDMAGAKQFLTPGGLYRATYSGQSILFGVHETAKPGAVPAISRLLRLPPS